jgi:hypothetical protein
MCNLNTKELNSMWEVIATSKNGRVRTKVVNNWKIGMQLAGRAMDMGWKVSILPVYVDFFVVGDDGELTQVVVRVSPQTAARYAVRWAKMDRNQSGCIAWPHKVPMPAGWKVVRQEAQ